MKLLEVDARKQSCISEEQAQFFLDNGFLVIRNALGEEELQLIREEMMVLLEKGAAGVEGDADFMYGKGGKTGAKVLKRIEYVIDKSDAMKRLLGHPFILRSVEKLQGSALIPTWDSMVVKMPDEGIIVPWHRDGTRPEPEGSYDPRPIFNVDFYLDEADLSNCLWVIPGSNLWSTERAKERYSREGFDTSDAIPVPMNPGDVIFHDIMVLHGSPAGDGNALRRTVYYEFRPADLEAKYGPHNEAYIRLKQQLLLACIERRKSASYGTEETQFEYRPDGAFAINDIQQPETYRYAHEDFAR
ncbi:phytanoyl-CoA dioxygenase family protein [Cohnella silvisoli]|uniref:Phytanoyl-CoA dioxygenase family protein n=1 Tax=Cohnella silvisoli TaxID=2873699 RepID=A0ABV1KT07_9BACL|nr:phytanoyl-CoA dioxygenase family protein [Cohnella silvisoli]MCD9021363.1 phytanoyl-CoA dioxygenase family protein [Cohnella silvisoli]